MKTLGIIVAICATIYVLNWLRTDANKSMEACQETRSYETCAWDILR